MTRSKLATTLQTLPVKIDEKQVIDDIPFRSKPSANSIKNGKNDGEDLERGQLNTDPSTAVGEEIDDGPLELQQESEKNDDHDLQHTPHHLYIQITADMNARQINGDLILGKSTMQQPKHLYHGVVAKDNSIQINGNIQDPEALTWLLS